jgi:predicted methyltransferase
VPSGEASLRAAHGGTDRSATRDLIFPKSLAVKTALDVGCALGYFCFEAEARGAARVVRVEQKKEAHV